MKLEKLSESDLLTKHRYAYKKSWFNKNKNKINKKQKEKRLLKMLNSSTAEIKELNSTRKLTIDEKIEVNKKRRNKRKLKELNKSQNDYNAGILEFNFDEVLITESYLGKMNSVCEFCSAKHFESEHNAKDKNFNSCCRKGKIKLSEDSLYPDRLKQLITSNTNESKHFKKNIRLYNNALAFAIFGAKFDKLFGKGPQIIRICGQIYHNIYALHPNINEGRKYGQLYIVDNEIASLSRIENNIECNLDLFKELDNLMREINIYAKSYKMMHELEKEQLKRSNEIGYINKDVKMYFTRNSYHDKHRYNKATCNEVAVVFVGEDGEPPVDRDICIYSKFEKPVSIPFLSKHVDPMTYPLIFPNGKYGWMPNMKCIDNKNNISTLLFYNYKFSIRNDFSPFINLGKLTQQFIVDAWVKVEGSRLYYLKQNQHILRTDLYKGVMDYLKKKMKKKI